MITVAAPYRTVPYGTVPGTGPPYGSYSARPGATVRPYPVAGLYGTRGRGRAIMAAMPPGP
eukprot:342624-Hanusia_phi.AAC.1